MSGARGTNKSRKKQGKPGASGVAMSAGVDRNTSFEVFSDVQRASSSPSSCPLPVPPCIPDEVIENLWTEMDENEQKLEIGAKLDEASVRRRRDIVEGQKTPEVSGCGSDTDKKVLEFKADDATLLPSLDDGIADSKVGEATSLPSLDNCVAAEKKNHVELDLLWNEGQSVSLSSAETSQLPLDVLTAVF